MQLVVGLLAHVRLARIHADVRARARGHVHRGAARIVVVGHFRRAAPRHVHVRMRHRLHPAVSEARAHERAEMARPLADLPRLHDVGGIPQIHAVRRAEHAPHARGAAHAEQAFAAVFSLELVELRHDRRYSLVPADAHPAGIVRIFRVRAFHRIAQPVGMVGRLKRRLPFRAVVASRLERALVALRLHDLSVLHGHPHAALHLAASAAARANALDLSRARRRGVALLGQSLPRRRRRAQRGGRHRRDFRERAARHGQSAHSSSSRRRAKMGQP